MSNRAWILAAAALAMTTAAVPTARAAFDGEFVRKLCDADGSYVLSAVEDAAYASAGLAPITYRREQPLPVRVYQFVQRPDQARLCTVVFASSRDGTICEEAGVIKSSLTLSRGGWGRVLCPSQQ